VAVKAKRRQYPTAFKLKAIKRAEEGEGGFACGPQAWDIAQTFA
jgi:hypothetical protein